MSIIECSSGERRPRGSWRSFRRHGLLSHPEAARIKGMAETVKALYHAVAPIAAGSAAIRAACNHIIF
jgi:hypothetical protein